MQFVILGNIKIDVYKTFTRQRNGFWKSPISMFLKVWQDRIVWYLFGGLKTITLCFIHSTWLEKYLFSTIYGSWKLQTESWNTNHEYECSILTIRMLTSLETPLCFMSFISVTIFSIFSQVSWNSNKSEAESRLIACSSSYLIIWRSRLSGWFF